MAQPKSTGSGSCGYSEQEIADYIKQVKINAEIDITREQAIDFMDQNAFEMQYAMSEPSARDEHRAWRREYGA